MSRGVPMLSGGLFAERHVPQTVFGQRSAATKAQISQTRMAEEQWEWQKNLQQQQLAAQRGGVSAISRMVGAYGKAFGQAKTANERRYEEMLGISRAETQRQAGVQEGMLGAIGTTTGQRAADIRAGGVQEEANIMQRLARTGMGGTTIGTTQRAGVRRGTGEQLNRLADLMQERKLGVMRGIAAPRRGGELGIMERRTDKYPDPSMLTSLAGMFGAGGGGAGMAGALSKMRLG